MEMAILLSVTVSMGDEMKGVLRQTRLETLWGASDGRLSASRDCRRLETADSFDALGLERNIRGLRNRSIVETRSQLFVSL
jgi:hypothetical protein